MKVFFADTSFYVAVLNETDADHSRASSLIEPGSSRIATPSMFFWELANFLAGNSGRALFVPFRDELVESPLTPIVPASRGLANEGIAIYARHRDKEWSLTDCVSFAVMRRLKITEALTADHHFVQAGFRTRLLGWRA